MPTGSGLAERAGRTGYGTTKCVAAAIPRLSVANIDPSTVRESVVKAVEALGYDYSMREQLEVVEHCFWPRCFRVCPSQLAVGKVCATNVYLWCSTYIVRSLSKMVVRSDKGCKTLANICVPFGDDYSSVCNR